MDFRLRILAGLGPEVALELRDATDLRAIPDNRAVEIDVDLDDFRRIGGGGLLVWGMSSLVACVMMGIDMINTMMSTNMTSMSGVVLISIIGAPSAPPVLIATESYL